MAASRKPIHIISILVACILVSGALLYFDGPEPEKKFRDWDELDQYLLQQIYDFGYPYDRVRTRTIQVNDDFSRRVITVNAGNDFPRTLFHKTLSDSLRPYRFSTYGVVQLPDRIHEIHIIRDHTVVRTIRMER